MHTPQIIWIFLAGGTIFVSLMKHGEPKGNYNFWTTLIAMGLEFWIVYAGGFFK